MIRRYLTVAVFCGLWLVTAFGGANSGNYLEATKTVLAFFGLYLFIRLLWFWYGDGRSI